MSEDSSQSRREGTRDKGSLSGERETLPQDDPCAHQFASDGQDTFANQNASAQRFGYSLAFDWAKAIDAIKALIFIHDASYRIIEANQVYLECAGINREQAYGRVYWEVFPLRSGPLPGCQSALEAELAKFKPAREADREAGRAHFEGGQGSCSEAEAVEEITLDSGESLISRSFPIYAEEGEYLYSIHVIEDVTQQRIAEQARWAAEAKAWAFAYAAQDAIVVSDECERIVFANQAAERLLGEQAKGLAGLSLRGDFRFYPYEQGVSSRGIGEATISVRAGEVVPVEVSAASLSLEGRQHEVRILRDIRERKATARALRERENQLDYLLANTTEGILVIDGSGIVLYANTSAGELFGLTSAQLCGREFGFAIPSNEAQEIEIQDAELQMVRTVEMRVREVRWEGEAAKLLNLHDVTARKQVELQLRQAAIVFEEAAEGIIITDAEQRIVAVNLAFTQITGYTQAEVLGYKPRILRSGVHSQEFYQSMWQQIREHGYWSGEIWNRRRNGDIYAQVLTIREVLDENSQPSHYLAVFSDISSVKEYQRQLERLMHRDPLTGLPNRLLFHDRVEQALAMTRRPGHCLAVLSIDVGDFKAINDSFGHSVGDEVLEQLAGRLTEVMSEEDTVARLGGDEFGILIPDLNNAVDVASLVEGLMERIHQPFMIQGYDVPSVTRIGVSIYPDKAASAGDLIEQADAAMYEAKAQGVRYRFFSRELTEKAQDRVQLGSELRQALVSGEGLQVYYQPQVQLADGSWTGMEALARWYHPSRGWISPGRFIPVAERSGLVVELGGFVLESACAQQRKWLDQGYDFGRMGVNFSAMQLVEEDLVDKVMNTLEDTGLPAERLEVEITESLLVEPDEGMVRRLQQLREHGVRVSIDDFGTGYSSLSYLKDLPVDCLKIDRSFVDGLPEDAHVTAISRAITALGHSLGFSVIAEGIETVEQCQSLLTEGCERGQGFYFARPEAAVELLEHHPRPGAKRR